MTLVDEGLEPIAIIGLGCVFPGAGNVEEYWQNIITKENSIKEVSDSFWSPSYFWDPDRNVPNKTYSKIGGFIDSFNFNPLEFRIPPKVAESLDRVQKLALVSAKAALHDSGYLVDERTDKVGRPFDRERTAVVIGNSMGGSNSRTYTRSVYFPVVYSALESALSNRNISESEAEKVLSSFSEAYNKGLPDVNEDSMPGELANVIAGRIANCLNLRGQNFTTDAACASTLAAVESASYLLRSKNVDMVLCGGSDASMDPVSFTKFSKIGALSATGSRPFDAGADGFVMGEGSGFFVLKRLSDAVRDNDKIYALITGIGGSSDGKGKGITAPNKMGQVLAVQRAWASAKIKPSDLQLIEAHGTSTSVGDLVELQALQESIEKSGDNVPHTIHIGSIKSQIGHLKSAAAAASIIKVCLGLYKKTKPPSINVTEVNPSFNWDSSPLKVIEDAQEWNDEEIDLRRAGVSSFGFGGTNFHIIMEEYDPNRWQSYLSRSEEAPESIASIDDQTPATSSSVLPWDEYVLRNKDLQGDVVAFSGSKLDDITSKIDLFVNNLPETVFSSPNGKHPVDIYRTQGFSPSDSTKCVFSISSPTDLTNLKMSIPSSGSIKIDNLLLLQNRGIHMKGDFSPPVRIEDGVAFLFTGQGSQYVNMLSDLRSKYSIVDQTFKEADDILKSYLPRPLSEYIFLESDDEGKMHALSESLKQTEITQPAILVTGVALYRLFLEHNIKPTIVAGHSLGEYGALIAAGVLSFEDALRAVAIRGSAMANAAKSEAGTMASVGADEEVVQKIIDECSNYVIAANKNSLKQTVVSGTIDGVNEVIEKCKVKGIQTTLLSVSTAFHTKIVASASAALNAYLDKITFNSPNIPILSNVTGEFYPNSPGEIRKILKKQLESPVEWVTQLQNIAETGVRVFVEIGPKGALSSFCRSTLVGLSILSLASNHPKKGDIYHFNNVLAAFIAGGHDVRLPPSASSPIYHDLYRWNSSHLSAADSTISYKSASSSHSKSNTNNSTFPEFWKIQEPLLKEMAKAIYNSQIEESSQLGNTSANHVLDRLGLNTEEIVVTGISVGLPGTNKDFFDETNFERLFNGENFIDHISLSSKKETVKRNIVRLLKYSSGSGKFETVQDVDEVIKLAAQSGNMDFVEEFQLADNIIDAYGRTTQLAVGAGLLALKDAGIPLVQDYKQTSIGSFLPGEWQLPEELKDDTGVIFSSAFPGDAEIIRELHRYFDHAVQEEKKEALSEFYSNLVKILSGAEMGETVKQLFNEEVSKYSDSEYAFNRKFLFRILSMGHSQFAQLIGARGPNTQINAACASNSQAVGIAEDWIRTGRCKRVIVISADDITSEVAVDWFAAGFLASGVATTENHVKDAALPFDKRRHGMIMGMGASAIVIETLSEAERRGVYPIAKILGTHYLNSAYHGSRLDVEHVTQSLSDFFAKMERAHDIKADDIAEKTIFVSHETYTPARGGSASAEIQALHRSFSKNLDKLYIANTKGFTGHAMGSGIEDVIALRSLEVQKVPPIANFQQPDPELGDLSISTKTRSASLQYALRLAAGFGSQIAFILYERYPFVSHDRRNKQQYDSWLKGVGGSINDLTTVGRSLRLSVPSPSEIDNSTIQPSDPLSAYGNVPAETPSPLTSQEPSSTHTSNELFEGLTDSDLRRIVTDFIAEHTGYSVDMLDPDMDMEADLGIDTVKQAEIFGLISEKFNFDFDSDLQLSDYSTINSLVKLISQYISLQPKQTQTTKVDVDSSPTLSMENLQMFITEIIVEQTGYSVDMLDPDMDMEADLGIDTVKQAEILGILGDRFNFSIDADFQISDYTTISLLTEFAYSLLDQNHDETLNESPVEELIAGGSTSLFSNKLTQKTASTHFKKSGVDEGTPSTSSNLLNEIKQVISESTGYSTDLLDSSADLEADLGIDTIKQAEILGVLREKYHFSIPDDLQLSDYSTIDSITKLVSHYLSDKNADKQVPVAGSEFEESNTLLSSHENSLNELIHLFSEQTGYPESMLDPDMDLEADLGIDTVKQAEIFGILSDKYKLSIDENVQLTEYSTISKINDLVTQLSSKSLPEASESTITASRSTEETVKIDDSSLLSKRYVIQPLAVNAKSMDDNHESNIEPNQLIVLLPSGKLGKSITTLFEESYPGFKLVNKFSEITADMLSGGKHIVLINPTKSTSSSVSHIYRLVSASFDNILSLTLAVKSSPFNGKVRLQMSPLQGAISGLIKSVSQEKSIPSSIFTWENIEEIISELKTKDERFGEVIYHNKIRYKLALVNRPLLNVSWQMPEDTSLLVTGGGSGITYECLSAICAPDTKIGIIGRTKLSNEEELKELAALSEDEIAQRKQNLLETLKASDVRVTPVLLEKEWLKIVRPLEVWKNLNLLRNRGVRVEYYAVDIREKKSVSEAISKLCEGLDLEENSFDYLVHGAGVEISKPMEKKDIDEFNLVYDVKVKGFENLLSCLNLSSLRRVVVFSSVAGRFGNMGQADYSAANDCLSKLCSRLQKKENINATAIDWSAWDGVGMATRGSTMKVLSTLGVSPIPLKEGIAHFVNEFSGGSEDEVVIFNSLGDLAANALIFDSESSFDFPDDGQYSPVFSNLLPMIDKTVSNPELGWFNLRSLSLNQDLYLDDHRINGVAVLPGVMGIEAMIEHTQVITGSTVSMVHDVQFMLPIKLHKDNPAILVSEFNPSESKTSLYTLFTLPNNEKQKKLHFSAKMVTGKKQGTYPYHNGLDESNIDFGKTLITNDEIYRIYFHGPGFQVLDCVIDKGDSWILGKFNMPSVPLFSEESKFNRDSLVSTPLTVEAGFQLAGMLDIVDYQTSSLPAGIDLLIFYENLQPPYFISAVRTKRTERISYYNVQVLDKDRRLIIEMRGFQMIHTGTIEVSKKIADSESLPSEKEDLRNLLLRVDENVELTAMSSSEDMKKKEVTAILTDEENAIYSSFSIPKRKHDWLSGVLAAKRSLQLHHFVPLNSINIRKNENRKPLAYIHELSYPISITHSNGIALGITENSINGSFNHSNDVERQVPHGIGIDLEKIRQLNEQFIHTAFSDRELELYPQLKDDNLWKLLFWTAKEAFSKKAGLGLKLNPKKMAVSVTQDKSQSRHLQVLVKSPDSGISPSDVGLYWNDSWVLAITL